VVAAVVVDAWQGTQLSESGEKDKGKNAKNGQQKTQAAQAHNARSF